MEHVFGTVSRAENIHFSETRTWYAPNRSVKKYFTKMPTRPRKDQSTEKKEKKTGSITETQWI